MSDHYNLFGVPATASAEELRRAFRREAKRCHPDLNAGRPPAERAALQRRFIQLAQAYQVLSNPEQRAAYDRQRAAQGPARHAGGTETGSGQRPARASPAPSGDPVPPRGRNSGLRPEEDSPGPDVAGIRRDAEESLAAFGLNLRLPAEAALEQMLDWARGLYRDLANAVRPPSAQPSERHKHAPGAARSRPQTGAGAEARAAPRAERASERHQAPHGAPKGRGTPETTASEADGSDEAAIEHELARIKRAARGGGSRSRSPTVDEELAELKRKHGRKPPA